MARRDEGEMAPTSEIHGRSMRDPCEIHVSTCRSMRAVGSQRLRSAADGSPLRSTPPAAAALALHRAGRRERDGLQSWRAEMLERICRLAVASHISQRAVQHRCMGRDTASTVCFTLKSYFYFTVRERPENGRCSRCRCSRWYIHCFTHAGTKGREVRRSFFKFIAHPVFAPGGLLFCVLYEQGEYEQDEIVALDAQTMQPRHRFGQSLLNYARVGWRWWARSCLSATIRTIGCRSSHSLVSTAARSRPGVD